jgi:hypothetical protein
VPAVQSGCSEILGRGTNVFPRVGAGGERSASLQHDEPSLADQLLFGPPDHVSAHAVLLRYVQFARQPTLPLNQRALAVPDLPEPAYMV